MLVACGEGFEELGIVEVVVETVGATTYCSIYQDQPCNANDNERRKHLYLKGQMDYNSRLLGDNDDKGSERKLRGENELKEINEKARVDDYKRSWLLEDSRDYIYTV